MANTRVRAESARFNPAAILAACLDPEELFWRRHAAWQSLEAEERDRELPEGDPAREQLIEGINSALAAMFASPVSSAKALQAKLVAVQDAAGFEVAPGVSAESAIEADCARMVEIEAAAEALGVSVRSVAWDAARAMETFAIRIEGVERLAALAAESRSLDEQQALAIHALADLIGHLRGDLGEIEDQFDAIAAAARSEQVELAEAA